MCHTSFNDFQDFSIRVPSSYFGGIFLFSPNFRKKSPFSFFLNGFLTIDPFFKCIHILMDHVFRFLFHLFCFFFQNFLIVPTASVEVSQVPSWLT